MKDMKGALLVGPVIPVSSVVSGVKLAEWSENRERLILLSKTHRLRQHSDGWFVDGKGHKSQIWEYAIGKLGLTVIGSRFVRKCRAESDWLNPKAVGDQEANFYCLWTDDNLSRLTRLTGLQLRKAAKLP